VTRHNRVTYAHEAIAKIKGPLSFLRGPPNIPKFPIPAGKAKSETSPGKARQKPRLQHNSPYLGEISTFVFKWQGRGIKKRIWNT